MTQAPTQHLVEEMKRGRLDLYIAEGRNLIRQQIASLRQARSDGLQITTNESLLPALVVTVSALRRQRRHCIETTAAADGRQQPAAHSK